MLGFNPAIAKTLFGSFDVDEVLITELNRENVRTVKCGVITWDGRTPTEELIRDSNVVLVTGTALVNGTFGSIWHRVPEEP
ncbi:MAG: hypothetical protein KJ749_05895 [Planctomycetes bacterium]|nr:hypothetical protein [Planctomycetota bacterium]